MWKLWLLRAARVSNWGYSGQLPSMSATKAQNFVPQKIYLQKRDLYVLYQGAMSELGLFSCTFKYWSTGQSYTLTLLFLLGIFVSLPLPSIFIT